MLHINYLHEHEQISKKNTNVSIKPDDYCLNYVTSVLKASLATGASGKFIKLIRALILRRDVMAPLVRF